MTARLIRCYSCRDVATHAMIYATRPEPRYACEICAARVSSWRAKSSDARNLIEVMTLDEFDAALQRQIARRDAAMRAAAEWGGGPTP